MHYTDICCGVLSERMVFTTGNTSYILNVTITAIWKNKPQKHVTQRDSNLHHLPPTHLTNPTACQQIIHTIIEKNQLEKLFLANSLKQQLEKLC